MTSLILFLFGSFMYSYSFGLPLLFEDNIVDILKSDVKEEDGIELDKLSGITHSPLKGPSGEPYHNIELWPTVQLQKRDVDESINSTLPTTYESSKSTDSDHFGSETIPVITTLQCNSLEANFVEGGDDDDDDDDANTRLGEFEDDNESIKNSSSVYITNDDYVLQLDNATDSINDSLANEEYISSAPSVPSTAPFPSDTNSQQDSELNDYQGNDYFNVGDKPDVETDLSDDEDNIEDSTLPFELQNLPRDIPKDYTIAEILAENTLKDKHFDELRMEELIHELMTHTLGFGEIYSDETDYDIAGT